MSTATASVEDLKKSVMASLEAAGYTAIPQSSEKWAAQFVVSSSHFPGRVTLMFGEICERCGESFPFRVTNSQGTFGGRIPIPAGCDAATATDSLLREALPLLINRPPAPARGVGTGLLSPQEASKLCDALKARTGSH